MPTTKVLSGRSTPAPLMSLALAALLTTGCAFGGTPNTPSSPSCENLPQDHTASVFSASEGHPVERVVGRRQIGRVQLPRTLGASSFVHAEPGLTKAYLERLGDCEAFALTEKTGHRHVASVENRRGGFRVAVTSEDRDAAEALLSYALERQDAARHAAPQNTTNPPASTSL